MRAGIISMTLVKYQLLDRFVTRLERIIAALKAVNACQFDWELVRAQDELQAALETHEQLPP